MNLLSKEKRGLLFGNEAIVRGALESGASFISTYPGTPASEIGDTFAKIAKEAGIYFEYSTNEKTALESAAGAAFSGMKTIFSTKHYGMNVAADSLLPLVTFGCPLVIAAADDPGSWSSVQAEQDSRHWSRFAKIPTLEPSDSQEAKDMTKLAFELTDKYKIPIMLRLTTRICYGKSSVSLGTIKKGNAKGNFKKGWFKLGTQETIERHKKILGIISKLREFSEKSNLNFIEKGEGKTGIITSGISYNYAKEAMNELGITLPLLKIGFSYPLPEGKIKDFAKNLDKIIVIEELDPILENEVKRITGKDVRGKDVFPETGELKPEYVLEGISKIMNMQIKKYPAIDAPKRSPLFCAGCPHRSTFYAVEKTLGKNKIYGGDIGCYMLGAYPPYEIHDWIVSMGASVGIGHGVAKATNEKVVVFLGDSTFFHGGIPALLGMVYNNANALVIVQDNRLTAMTGHQPNPGTGWTGMGEPSKIVSIEGIAKACQVDYVKTSSVWNFNQLCKDIQECYDRKGVSVLVAKGECKLFSIKNLAKEGKDWPRFEITKQNPKLNDLAKFNCPAIRKEKGKWIIDKKLCWGCTVCKQLFPDSIEMVKQ